MPSRESTLVLYYPGLYTFRRFLLAYFDAVSRQYRRQRFLVVSWIT